jgi:hypothetical protein
MPKPWLGVCAFYSASRSGSNQSPTSNRTSGAFLDEREQIMSPDIKIINTLANSPAQVSPVLGPDTAAAKLVGISRAHLHRLRSSGKFGSQAIRLGRKLVFDLEECVAWEKAKCPDAKIWAAIQAATARRTGRVVG